MAGQGAHALKCAAALLLVLAASSARAGDPAVEGQWGPLMTWPGPAVHSHLLPDGMVMFFPELEQGDNPRTWDPATGAVVNLPRAGHNIFCSGHAFLPDGRLLIAGGHVANYIGLADGIVYDYRNQSWAHTPDMNLPRWYPSVTTLPNGDALVISGTLSPGENNNLPQVYQPATNTWRDLTGAVKDIPYYPWMYSLADGRVFFAGPRGRGQFIDTQGVGSWSWSAASSGGSRPYGTSVMYDEGKVIIIGGADPPKRDAERIDLSEDSPAWRSAGSMSQARRMANATLLPDGTVLVTGGSSGAGFDNKDAPVRAAELWNPASGEWTVLASEERYRGYHSTALLLPDGRVLSAGGRTREPTAQVFSPPYLFKGPRPTLTSAPETVGWGNTFEVSTPDASSIAQVTLIRLSSVTHAFNMNQRINKLAFSAGGGTLSVTAPASANLCPPGHYLLFLVNARGVPSVAKVVRVGSGGGTPPPASSGFAYGSTWKYHDGAVDLGTAWLTAGYDDSAWKSGPAQLGYGDGDERTKLTRLSSSASQPSLYFRKTLRLDAPVTAATLKALYDDGIAVWVNGTLVFSSSNMKNGTAYGVFASSGSADNAESSAALSLSPNPFVVGDNVIAAMVKQASASSSDASFDLALTLTLGTPGNTPTLRVTSPNGGEVLAEGSTAHLMWTTLGSVPTVKLELSTDAGATWTQLASGVPNNGVYDWVVPAVSSTRARLRVSGAGALDTSDADFTLQARGPGPLPGIPLGSVWKYHDGAVDLGTAWLTAGYDDSAWKSGPAQLGYGDGDEKTKLKRLSSTVSQPSLYFRKTLRLDAPVTVADLKVVFDDGIAVWVNGTSVYSRNMANGTSYGAFASANAADNTTVSTRLTLSPNPFIVGDNVVMVMVKQSSASSSDTSFDLELKLQGGP
ncbi:DUF1929 domain-containing protein [Myxococcaceae bacterium GXIMD 01537]